MTGLATILVLGGGDGGAVGQLVGILQGGGNGGFEGDVVGAVDHQDALAYNAQVHADAVGPVDALDNIKGEFFLGGDGVFGSLLSERGR